MIERPPVRGLTINKLAVAGCGACIGSISAPWASFASARASASGSSDKRAPALVRHILTRPRDSHLNQHGYKGRHQSKQQSIPR